MPIEDFALCRRNKDGRHSHCRECRRAHYQANRGRILAQQKEAYQGEGGERKRAYQRGWRQRNPNASREWFAAHPEYKREWYASNRERVADRSRAESERRRRLLRDAACGCVGTLDCTGASCGYCGAAADGFDHIQPLIRGGRHCVSNLIPACGPCNSAKRDKTLIEFIEDRERRGIRLLCDETLRGPICAGDRAHAQGYGGGA
ncbi:hypothetical protein QYM36_019434 [Artemia franciscana]|uniref:HNH domain-containing protein n=2 Tax=Artemia franciscana TaxID=6661 RepID=A0AA88H167_ARTSF|nr:hypothetical protein QYM36_019434 [Artemia franciscana]